MATLNRGVFRSYNPYAETIDDLATRNGFKSINVYGEGAETISYTISPAQASKSIVIREIALNTSDSTGTLTFTYNGTLVWSLPLGAGFKVLNLALPPCSHPHNDTGTAPTLAISLVIAAAGEGFVVTYEER